MNEKQREKFDDISIKENIDKSLSSWSEKSSKEQRRTQDFKNKNRNKIRKQNKQKKRSRNANRK